MGTGQPPVPAVPAVSLPTDAAKASHDQILQAAVEWLMEFGYAATKIDAVAQRLGATKGRIYHHDRSKADLYFDVQVAAMGRVTEAIEPIAAPRWRSEYGNTNGPTSIALFTCGAS